MDPKFCFYCDAVIEKGNIEEDHFPIPKCLGGEHVVPACKTCHSLKDRFSLDSWSEESLSRVSKELLENETLLLMWRTLGRETRIYLAKILRIMFESSDMQKKFGAQ